MKWKKHALGWEAVVPLADGASGGSEVNAWRCLVRIYPRPWGWMAARSPDSTGTAWPGPGRRMAGETFRLRRRGYGRTRGDAVMALRVACYNGWREAGTWSKRGRA